MIRLLFALLFLISVISACKESNSSIADVEDTDFDITDWTEATHGKKGDRNYDVVFPQDKVNRLDITISAENWAQMTADMESNYGTFGSNQGRPPAPGLLSSDPIYVPCSVFLDGTEWYKVGIRFKGNSSLRASWQSGVWKIPLRLNFDKYEDEYPQIDNQRFYGFKELSLSSGFEDKSLMREKTAPEIFRDLGVAAPQTAFYRIYIDKGEGSQYFGLYTLVEIVDDTVIEEQFESDEGNCYKPEGPSASFAAGGLNLSEFENKTNDGGWTDIETLYEVLHSALRTSDPEAWRDTIENVLDVDIFLRWLAVNITIQNWDTYGKMPHNYYLYNNPENNLLTWIPWDNNESLKSGKQGGALSISCNEVNEDWPLIRFLLDDEVYLSEYKKYLGKVINDAFVPVDMTSRYQEYHSLISPYVIGTDGEKPGYTFLNSDAEFTSALNELISHVNSRHSAVTNYLD